MAKQTKTAKQHIDEAVAAEIAATPQGSSSELRVPFGDDLQATNDLDERMRETSGDFGSLPQDLYHRITTPRGTVIDDPNFGYDCRRVLHGPTTQANLANEQANLTEELLKDDRVSEANLLFTIVSPKVIRLTIAITPANPANSAFSLVVLVTAEGSELAGVIAAQ